MPTYLSDESELIETTQVVIPPDRQRTTIDRGALDSLKSSIREHGLIHPIIVTRQGSDTILVVGERRLRAYLELNYRFIPARWMSEDFDPGEEKAVEFIENIERHDLSWQDRVSAVLKYHEMMGELKPTWTIEQSARRINLHESTTREYLRVARELRAGNPLVQEASSYSAARSALDRDFQRAVDTELEDLDSILSEEENPVPPEADDRLPQSTREALEARRPTVPRRASRDLFNEDFLSWIPKWDGPRFNFVNCNFPYGVDRHKSGSPAALSTQGTYQDDFTTYEALTLALLCSGLLGESVHILFWFSLHHYEWTRRVFSDAGFNVNPFPLIWHKSDNVGLLPDPQRGARRVYETAFHITRGDRKIVRPVSNLFPCPSNKAKALHPSEKPLAVLEYFFSMFVDGHTIMLDPTAGSGNSLIAAEKLCALRVTGCEIDESYWSAACSRLNNFRSGKEDALPTVDSDDLE